MPFNSKASPGGLRKYPRTDDFASAGGWFTAAVRALLASGWLSRYPLAAFSTPLEVAASPLAEHGSDTAPAVGATIRHSTQPGITPKIVRHNEFLTASSLHPQLFECSVHQLPKNTKNPAPPGDRASRCLTRTYVYCPTPPRAVARPASSSNLRLLSDSSSGRCTARIDVELEVHTT